MTTRVDLWLTAAEIARIEEISSRGVRWRLNGLLATANGTRKRYERRVRGNGGLSQEFNYSLIADDFAGAVKPEVLQAATEKFSGREHQTELALATTSPVALQAPPAEEQAPSLPFPKAITVELHEIPQKRLPLAQARFRAIELLREDDAWRKWEGQTVHGIAIAKKDDFVRALARDSELAERGRACLVEWSAINAELAHGTGKRHAKLSPASPATLWRWLGWYKKGRKAGAFQFASGIPALQHAPAANAGKSKIFGQGPRALDFYDEAAVAAELDRLTSAGRRLVELFLIERRSKQASTEVLSREFAALGLLKPPSYSRVSKWVEEQIPKPLHLWSRGRGKDFHDRCAPYVQRDYTSVRVMQGWVLDHGQDDFFVRNDYVEELDRLAFPERGRDEKLRMWVTAVEDIRSRFILGYAFCATPSSDTICSALRMAVVRTGRAPQFGLLDRGEDMKKVGKDKPQLPEAAQGAFRRLIAAQWGDSGRIIYSIGEHPQSKPIERWFGTKRARFDADVVSYCGRRPADRPDRCDELLEEHEQFLLAKREQSPLPRASEAIKATVWWIETWYNRQHHHTGHAMGRRTPEEVFRRGYPVSEQQKALAELDPRALDEFLRHREHCKVVNGGCVEMFKQQYEPADAQSLGRLYARIGRKVLVAADPYNLGDAVAFDPQTGERLGALASKKLLAWGADRNSIRAAMRHQRRAAKACRTYVEHLQRTHCAPEGAFGFLGEEYLLATGTDGRLALPPGRPINLTGVATSARKTAPAFISDADPGDGVFENVKLVEPGD